MAAVHQLSFELIKARDLILGETYHYIFSQLVFIAAGLRWIAGAAVVSVPCMSRNARKQILDVRNHRSLLPLLFQSVM